MSRKQNQEPKDEISAIAMTTSSISGLSGFYKNIGVLALTRRTVTLNAFRWCWYTCAGSCGISKQSTGLVRGLWFAEPHMRLECQGGIFHVVCTLPLDKRTVLVSMNAMRKGYLYLKVCYTVPPISHLILSQNTSIRLWIIQPKFHGLALDILQDALRELTADCVVTFDLDVSVFTCWYRKNGMRNEKWEMKESYPHIFVSHHGAQSSLHRSTVHKRYGCRSLPAEIAYTVEGAGGCAEVAQIAGHRLMHP